MGCVTSQCYIFCDPTLRKSPFSLVAFDNLSDDEKHPPAPCAPSKRKQDVFKSKNYHYLEEKLSHVADKYLLYTDVKTFVDHLVQGLSSDLERVRLLFLWVTSFDQESHQNDTAIKNSALKQLNRIRKNKLNLAHFFSQLVVCAGVSCVVINGLVKNSDYDIADEDSGHFIAQWNAVLLDGEWRLLDLHWASDYVTTARNQQWLAVDVNGESPPVGSHPSHVPEWNLNEFYFLTDPDRFVCTHLPFDPQWQLLPRPVTLNQFQTFVYIRERFFHLGLEMVDESMRAVRISTKQGCTNIVFGLPSASSRDQLEFRYVLSTAHQDADYNEDDALGLERFVMHHTDNQKLQYEIRLPLDGRYRFDIYGTNTSKDAMTFDLICSYILIADEVSMDWMPFPDSPVGGWGLVHEAASLGISCVNHISSRIKTNSSEVELRFRMTQPLHFSSQLLHLTLGQELLNQRFVQFVEGDELVVRIRPPQSGEYGLRMLACERDRIGEMDIVGSFLIDCNLPSGVQIKPTYPVLHRSSVGQGILAQHLQVVAMTTHETGIIEVKDKEVRFDFEIALGQELLAEINSNDVDLKSLTDVILRRVDEDNSKVTFHVSLPTPGEYAVNIYARMQTEQSRLFHIQTYLVNTGSTGDTTQSKITPDQTTHLSSLSDSFDIVEESRSDPLLAELEMTDGRCVPIPDQVLASRDGEKTRFSATLTECGEYSFVVLEQLDEPGRLQRVSSYTLIKEATSEQVQGKMRRFDQERMRRQRQTKATARKQHKLKSRLDAAIAADDLLTAEKLIRLCEAMGVSGDVLSGAKEQITLLKFTTRLQKAMATRDAVKLERAMEAGRVFCNKHGSERLKGLMEEAHRLLGEIYRYGILNMDQKSIAEVKSYQKPPEIVHRVMVAAMMILGNDMMLLRNWQSVRSLMGDSQKMKQKIRVFKSSDLPVVCALQALLLIDQLVRSEVEKVSKEATTFYCWTRLVVNDAVEQYTEAGGNIEEAWSKVNHRYTLLVEGETSFQATAHASLSLVKLHRKVSFPKMKMKKVIRSLAEESISEQDVSSISGGSSVSSKPGSAARVGPGMVVESSDGALSSQGVEKYSEGKLQ